MSDSTITSSDAASSPSGALVVRPDPFSVPSIHGALDGKRSVEAILEERLPGWDRLTLVVLVAGHTIPREWWPHVYPRPGALMEVRVVPQGGGGGGQGILLAASLAATFLAGPIAGAVGGALGLGAGGVGVLKTGIGLVLSLGTALAGALIPTRQPNQREDQSFGISAFRNASQPWGVPPYVRGRLRVFPKKAGQAIVENRGRFQVLRELFDFGPGPLRLTEFRNADRFLGNFDEDGSYDSAADFGGYDGVSIEWIEGATADALVERFYYGDTFSEEVNLELRQPREFDPGVLEEINPPLWVPGFDITDSDTYALAEGIAHPDDYVLVNRFRRHALTVEPDGSPAVYSASVKTAAAAGARVIQLDGVTGPDETIARNATVLISHGGTETTYFLARASRIIAGETTIRLTRGLERAVAADASVSIEEDTGVADDWPYYNYQSFEVGNGTTRADEIVLNITFPQGIYETDKETGETDYSGAYVAVMVQHGRKTLPNGDPDPDYQRVYWCATEFINTEPKNAYQPLFNTVHPALRSAYAFGDKFTAALYHEIRIRIALVTDGYSGPYVVTVWRPDSNLSKDDDLPTVTSASTLASVRTWDLSDAHRLTGHCLAQVRVRATGQLSGAMDQFNAVASSLVATPANDWSTDRADMVESRCPFLLAADCLLRAPGADRIASSRIALATFAAEHAANTDEDGQPIRPFDFTFDTRRSLRDVCNDILRVARARLVLPDGRFSVIVDDDTTAEPIRQLLTPRTINDVRRSVQFVERPDALRVRFANAERGWVEDEVIIPRDDLTINTAETFEELEVVGITDYRMAWLVATEAHIEAVARKERWQLTQSIAHLAYHVGDVVGLVHSTIDRAQQTARVLAVDTVAKTITLDTPIEMVADGSYRARWSSYRDTPRRIATSDAYAITTDASLPTTITVTGSPTWWPSFDDLLVVGPSTDAVRRLKVLEIRPRSDLSAQVTLVPEAPAIYAPAAAYAAGEGVPDYDDLRFTPPHDWPAAPTGLTVTPRIYVAGIFQEDPDEPGMNPLQPHVGETLTLAEAVAIGLPPMPTEALIDAAAIIDVFWEISWTGSVTTAGAPITYSVHTETLELVDLVGSGYQLPLFTRDPMSDWPSFTFRPRTRVAPDWFRRSPRPRLTGGDDPYPPVETAGYLTWAEDISGTNAKISRPLGGEILGPNTALLGDARARVTASNLPPWKRFKVYVTARSQYGETPFTEAASVTIDGTADANLERVLELYAWSRAFQLSEPAFVAP